MALSRLHQKWRVTTVPSLALIRFRIQIYNTRFLFYRAMHVTQTAV